MAHLLAGIKQAKRLDVPGKGLAARGRVVVGGRDGDRVAAGAGRDGSGNDPCGAVDAQSRWQAGCRKGDGIAVRIISGDRQTDGDPALVALSSRIDHQNVLDDSPSEGLRRAVDAIRGGDG